MPFQRGSLSYARFRVSGGPQHASPEMLAAMAEHVVKPPTVGPAPIIQAGWVGGDHLFDSSFDPDVMLFGSAVLAGLRVDTNRLPAEIRRAYRALTGAGGQRGRAAAEAKAEFEERCREELATGRHVRSRLVPVLWFVERHLLLAPIYSDAQTELLHELMETTFDATLRPLSAGALADDLVDGKGWRRAYEDCRPSPFTNPPPWAEAEPGRDSQIPSVPWSFASPEQYDYLGNEFLLWLWAQCEIGTGVIESPGGEVAVTIDRSLDMDCAWGATGKQSLRADRPTRLPEAAAALRFGKWPRKAGLVVARHGEQWELTFQADRFLITAARLPASEEAPKSAREQVELRLSSLESLDESLVQLYEAFLARRFNADWPAERAGVRKWISGKGVPRTGSVPAQGKSDEVEIITHPASLMAVNGQS